jgi:hypothetical protein
VRLGSLDGKKEMNPIVHDMTGLLYCGPAALAAITGLHTSAFESFNGPGKCGIDPMREALKLHGFGMEIRHIDGKYSLSDFDEITLCIVGEGKGHWVVVKSGMLLDCANKTPTPIKDTQYAEVPVRYAYHITKL